MSFIIGGYMKKINIDGCYIALIYRLTQDKAVDYYKTDKDNFIAIEDSNVGIQSALNANIRVINLKDIDIIKPDLKRKCLKCVESLNEVIDVLEEMRKL